MKRLILLLSAGLISLSCFAQGQLLFVNRVPGLFDAPIADTAGRPAGSYPGLIAELHLLSGGGPAVTPGLLGTTTFRTPEAQQAYLLPVTISIPGYASEAQGPVVLQVRVLAGSEVFQSVAFEATPGVAPNPPGNLIHMTGFTVPEPSTLVFGLLGATALLLCRQNMTRLLK